jgi:hypothetical protein
MSVTIEVILQRKLYVHPDVNILMLFAFRSKIFRDNLTVFAKMKKVAHVLFVGIHAIFGFAGVDFL